MLILRKIKIKTKKIKIFLFSFLFLFSPFSVFAGVGDLVLAGVGWAVLSVPATLLYVIFQFLGFIFGLSMKFLDLIISGTLFDAIFFSEAGRFAINQGWMVVRDFFNLFFVLILVFVAISIILNIEKYNDKKLIFKVILAAILINFSKAITMVVIDVSNLAMNFFAGAIAPGGKSFLAMFSDQMGLGNIFNFTFGGVVTFFIALLFATVFMFVLTGMVLTVTIALAVRLVAFWVLIILSPAAMFGLALPGSAIGNMTNNWMKKLISWAFFGPIMLFFLWVALVVVSATTVGVNNTLGLISVDSTGLDDASAKLITQVLSMSISYIAAIYLLYYGFDLSQEMSQGAAKATLNFGKRKINEWGKKAGSGYMNLATFGQIDHAKAIGAGVKNRIKDSKFIKPFTKEGRDEKYQERVARYSGKIEEFERKKNNEEMKKIEDDKSLTKEDIIAQMNNKSGSKESRVAAATYLAKNGHLNNGKDHLAAEEAMKLTKNKSLQKSFNKYSKENNSFGRYIGNVKKQREIIRSEFEKEGKPIDKKAIVLEARKRAKNNLKKEIDEKSFDDILKLDNKFFKDQEFFDHIRGTGFDFKGAVEKGHKNINGKKARTIRESLNRTTKQAPTENKKRYEDEQRELREKNQREINRNFPNA